MNCRVLYCSCKRWIVLSYSVIRIQDGKGLSDQIAGLGRGEENNDKLVSGLNILLPWLPYELGISEGFEYLALIPPMTPLYCVKVFNHNGKFLYLSMHFYFQNRM